MRVKAAAGPKSSCNASSRSERTEYGASRIRHSSRSQSSGTTMAWLRGIELATVANNMAAALSVLDSQRPQDAARRYRPGVGPLPETKLLARLLPILKASNPAVYAQAEPRPYPGSPPDFDLV